MNRIVLITLGLTIFLSHTYTARGATLTVTNCTDQTDLQNKINAASPGDTVTFSCGAPSSPVTIPITSSIVSVGQTLRWKGMGR